MPKSRNILPPRRYWKAWEVQFLSQNYTDSLTADLAQVLDRTEKQVLAKAAALGLHKSREIRAAMAREAMQQRPDHGGRAHQFRKGIVPANKGVKHAPGWAPGRMAEGQFKPGSKPHTWVPVGSYRVVQSKNGGQMLERKVNDLPGPTRVRWHPVHRLVWEAEHGPVPAGHIAVFKPGRRSLEVGDITVDAVDLITRQELIRRNTIHRLPPEFAEMARLKAVLHRVINHRLKKEGQQAEAP